MTPFELAAPYTMTGKDRQAALGAAAERVLRDNVPGVFVETGVWKGGNLLLAGLLMPERHVWGYDTFTGMDRPTKPDRSCNGKPAMEEYEQRGPDWCRAPLEDVDRLLGEHLGAGRYTLVKGRVEETLLDESNLPEQICILRLDTDWYTSYRAALERLYPRLSVGGVLILDDYGHWLGAKKAVDEYFSGQGVSLEKVDRHCRMVVKRAS